MGKSSKDKRDAYYRLAKEQGWRARSAFKLLQLDEEFDLFAGVSRVVDLCAAPGSWSQVLSRVLIRGERFGRGGLVERMERVRKAVEGAEEGGGETETETDREVNGKERGDKAREQRKRGDVKIVAIDLQPMSPLEGITMLRADITHPSTIPRLLEALDPGFTILTDPTTPTFTDSFPSPLQATPPTPDLPKPTNTHRVDLLLSDGAPDVTGLHDLDIYIQSQLLRSALDLALRVLKPGGTFVAKIFRGKDVDLLYAQLGLVFARVTVAKPRSSRASSLEAFVVCEGFRGEEAAGLGPAALGGERTKAGRRRREDGILEVELGSDDGEDEEEADSERRWIAPFLACGDLSAYDADATYSLPEGHVSLDPVQPPTAPPYKKALEMRRAAGGAYGKTKGRKPAPPE